MQMKKVFKSSENNSHVAHRLAVVLNYSYSYAGHQNALETLEYFVLNSPLSLSEVKR